jgi:hypothetical protein
MIVSVKALRSQSLFGALDAVCAWMSTATTAAPAALPQGSRALRS